MTQNKIPKDFVCSNKKTTNSVYLNHNQELEKYKMLFCNNEIIINNKDGIVKKKSLKK